MKERRTRTKRRLDSEQRVGEGGAGEQLKESKHVGTWGPCCRVGVSNLKAARDVPDAS
jgi:hypothetical protein